MASPLIQRMIEQHGYPLLGRDDIDEFIERQQECVLFFTEDPERFPESNDVAMILPELVREYGGRFGAAVIERASERELQARYGFNEWPALVFLRRGRYLGAICRVQDWAEYLAQINRLLAAEPRSTPVFPAAVETGRSGCAS